jgi:hypothetical protein
MLQTGGDTMQVLIVEGSADDTGLLLAGLEYKGSAPIYERVETKLDFLDALQNRSWDAVRADYILPRFSGPEAIKLLLPPQP